ncbi:hypothetical protein [Paenibacillus sp. PAMC21692]|uniref:hypothetical protein n=1 Tax=Paenibacillus sp. PAMC21692 TaxID=2762320 RepID=UPI00164DB0A2|nr:hypothetical protein [Paenibacillus sp. PAMC21692]QNK58180.1 hypothetical protein H7F31_04315 [Paenibacillus sp. PAMC21692]
MPLPLIPAIAVGIAAVTAAVGAKKGFDAKRDMDQAKALNQTSQDIAKEAEEFVEMARENTNEAITELGQEKIRILSTSINEFVVNFEKIKNINLKDSDGIDELRNFNPSSESFKQLKNASFEAKTIAINGLAAIGSGALLAYGTYSVVMSGLGGLLVTATTGTALGTLSGVAATNATLAWLGGGALAAGGLGVAGGMMVLGGIVAGPALAIGGAIFASQAKSALNDAYGNYDKAKAFKAQAKNIGIALKAIYTRANQLTELLKKLDVFFVHQVSVLRFIIKSRGMNWDDYSEVEKQEIYKCVQLAKTIKVILDSSLLKQEGQLEEASAYVVENGNKYLETLMQG